MGKAVTIRELWHTGRGRIGDPEARLLLQHLLQVNHTYLIAHDNEVVPAEQVALFENWLERAEKAEPIPYIIGSAPFYGRTFAVSPAVLIPRPETELLVEEALSWLRGVQRPVQVVDVGTGSGCIAISLACEILGQLPAGSAITAVDISPAALAMAQHNAHTHQAAVTFLASNLLTQTPPSYDLIVANLPYISKREWPTLADGVKSYEPTLALLDEGEEGLALIRNLLEQVAHYQTPPSLILLEIGWQQGKLSAQLAQSLFPQAQIAVLPDWAGHDRIVKIAL